MSWFTDFISQVYSDLGERPDYTEEYLTAWFLDSANLGILSNKTGIEFALSVIRDTQCQIISVEINPAINGDVLAIYKSIFDEFFYGREAKLCLYGSYGASAWTILEEGDSKISRVGRSELARTFGQMQKEAREATVRLVKEYLRNKAATQSVNGDDTVGETYYIYNSRSPLIRVENF